jgi:maleate isomerase
MSPVDATTSAEPVEDWAPMPIWFKLGHIVPHLRTDTTPYQFYRVAPPGVMLVTVPFDLRAYSLTAIEDELPLLWERVDALVERDVDRVVLAGVPVAAALGRPRVVDLVERIAARTGGPADADLEAHVAAANHLGVRTVAMATRWDDTINAAVVHYLASAGIAVVSTAALGRDLGANKASDPNDDHRLMLELGRSAVEQSPVPPEALFLPGGLGLVVDAAAALETQLDLPVLTNATATLWAALSEHGPLGATPGAYPSRLLRTLAHPHRPETEHGRGDR